MRSRPKLKHTTQTKSIPRCFNAAFPLADCSRRRAPNFLKLKSCARKLPRTPQCPGSPSLSLFKTAAFWLGRGLSRGPWPRSEPETVHDTPIADNLSKVSGLGVRLLGSRHLSRSENVRGSQLLPSGWVRCWPHPKLCRNKGLGS